MGYGAGEPPPDSNFAGAPPNSHLSGNIADIGSGEAYADQQQSAGADSIGGGSGVFYQSPSLQQQQQQQEQQYQSPPYIPQESRWTGYYAGPQEHQQPHRQQQQPQGYYSQQPVPPPTLGAVSDPLRTKWRSIVSRVKDVVRPGHPAGYDYSGYQAGGGRSGGGGNWRNDGGGASGSYPPDSTWGSNAHLNGGYVPGSSYAQTGGYSGYVQEQAAPDAYDPRTTQGGYNQGGPPPRPFFDGRGSIDSPAAQEARSVDREEGAAWQPQFSVSTPGISRSFYNSGGDGFYEPETPFDADGCHGSPQYAPGIESGTPADRAVLQGGQMDAMRRAVPPGPSSSQELPREQGRGQAGALAEQASVGQGWGAANPALTHAAAPQQSQQGEKKHSPEEGGEYSRRPPSAYSPPSLAPNSSFSHGSGSRTVDGEAASTSGAGNDDNLRGAVDDAPPPDTRPQSGVSATAGGSLESERPVSSGHGSGVGTWRSETQTAEDLAPDASRTASSPPSSSSYISSVDGPLDPMPSSVDHGLAKVDWGTGAEEESMEPDFVTTGEFGAEGDREEEALIRELERMDGIGGGEVGGVTTPPEELAGDSDEAVEHTLDVLFDSIREDGEDDDDDTDDDAEDTTDELASRALDNDGAPTETLASIGNANSHPGTKAMGDEKFPDRFELKDCVAAEFEAGRQGQETWHEYPDDRRAVGSDIPRESATSSGVNAYDDLSSYGDGAAVAWSVDAADAREDGGEEEDHAISDVSPPSASNSLGAENQGSFWGTRGRWASLPTHMMVLSEPGESEEGGDSDDDVAVVDHTSTRGDGSGVLKEFPLDPIELPPSAASDEIWNDQHLQDQLDAYWEQSRRAGGGGSGSGGGGGGGGVLSRGGQQLSRYEQNLQPTYGPGDWVGRGAMAAQRAAMLQEPLPGATANGMVQSAWGTGTQGGVPNLFQGNQAPVHIYGDFHVHLRQQDSNQGREQGSPLSAAELSARERYYSQGETSWSGSERGGH